MSLTRRQRKYYDSITGFIAEHGVSPSYEEIAVMAEINAISSVFAMLRRLYRKGYIGPLTNSARSITIIGKCPYCEREMPRKSA